MPFPSVIVGEGPITSCKFVSFFSVLLFQLYGRIETATGLGKVRLQLKGPPELSDALIDPPLLQKHDPQSVMPFDIVRLDPQGFPEVIGALGEPSLCPQKNTDNMMYFRVIRINTESREIVLQRLAFPALL